jgi:hypothetical protein
MPRKKRLRRHCECEEAALRDGYDGSNADATDASDDDDDPDTKCDTRPRQTPPRFHFVTVLESGELLREAIQLLFAIALFLVVAKSFYASHERAILNLFDTAVWLSPNATSTRTFPEVGRVELEDALQRPR